MNILLSRWSALACAIGLFTTLATGCVAPGGGYGYDNGVGVGVDYYEPYGGYYGGWGSGYRVGPSRGGYDHGGGGYRGGGGSPGGHSFRSPAASHSMPSIPSGARGGGGGRRR